MKQKITFLVDCNNFFVSCERVFDPTLRGKPVAVLSSNDGCAVARSNEVKALGVPMGVPYFKVRTEFEKYNIITLSSNFRLYGDMSDRVMSILKMFCDDVDQYSIDEAFLTYEYQEVYQYEVLARAIRARVLRWTGLPISIGIAPTKTLAKVASKLAKKREDGVYSLINEEIRPDILRDVQVGEVWNIGRNFTKRLVGQGITNAQAFAELPDHWLKTHMGVLGLRIAHELRGIACFKHQAVPVSKKSIMCSRSFGKAITEKRILKEAIAHHVVYASSKMRRQDCKATWLRAYAYIREKGADFRDKSSGWQEFQFPTDDTGTLIRAAHSIVDDFFEKRFRYVKVGILLAGFVPKETAPTESLFEKTEEDKKAKLMECVDDINSYFGRDTVVPLAALRTTDTWLARKNLVTPEYTTSWKGVVKSK